MNPIWTVRLSSRFSGMAITLSPRSLFIGVLVNIQRAFGMPDPL
jgi:hypothetical protein